MLTTHQIREHFESIEVERLRAQVQELQARVNRLQSELLQVRRDAHTSVSRPSSPSSED